jgi:hypothetical protein
VTIEQLEELERLADRATKGSWQRDTVSLFASDIMDWGKGDGIVSGDKYFDGVKTKPDERGYSSLVCGVWEDCDIDYISAADPPTVKTLIRALRSMASKCSELYMDSIADENFWPHKGDIAKKANELLQQALEEDEK